MVTYAVASSSFTHKQLQLVLYRKLSMIIFQAKYSKAWRNTWQITSWKLFLQQHNWTVSNEQWTQVLQGLTVEHRWHFICIFCQLAEIRVLSCSLSFGSICINQKTFFTTLVPFCIWNSMQTYSKNRSVYLFSYYICIRNFKWTIFNYCTMMIFVLACII